MDSSFSDDNHDNDHIEKFESLFLKHQSNQDNVNSLKSMMAFKFN